MSKTSRTTMIVLAVLIVLALGGELAVGWFSYSRLSEGAGTLSALQKNNEDLRSDLAKLHSEFGDFREQFALLVDTSEDLEDPGQEDDVRIAGEYVIQSTLPISDAYHSGDRSALNDKQKETLDMASAILAEIITEDMDAYDKEVAVYSWMTKNLVHDEGLLPVIPQTQSDCDNPYGVLKYHNAVCVGYATTFRMFMQMLDIPCKVVHNSERYHSWDLVQMGDGWYHTDIYSDAGRGNFANFNLTDTMQSQRQNWNTDFFPPASRLEYCYAYRMSTEETDPYHVPAALRAALDNRDTILALRFVDNSMNETNAQIVQSMLESIRNVLYRSPYDSQLYMDWNWMAADQDWLLSVTLTWYEQGEDPDPVLTDEDYEKIANAVQEAFGDIESTEDYPYYDDSNENIVWGK